VRGDGLCVKGENVFLRWYAGSPVRCFVVRCFAGTWFRRVVDLSRLEFDSRSHHQNGMGPMPRRRSWVG
jgi:hypothetical protein